MCGSSAPGCSTRPTHQFLSTDPLLPVPGSYGPRPATRTAGTTGQLGRPDGHAATVDGGVRRRHVGGRADCAGHGVGGRARGPVGHAGDGRGHRPRRRALRHRRGHRRGRRHPHRRRRLRRHRPRHGHVQPADGRGQRCRGRALRRRRRGRDHDVVAGRGGARLGERRGRDRRRQPARRPGFPERLGAARRHRHRRPRERRRRRPAPSADARGHRRARPFADLERAELPPAVSASAPSRIRSATTSRTRSTR